MASSSWYRIFKAALGQTLTARPVWANPLATFMFFLQNGICPNNRAGGFRLGRIRFAARLTDWLAVREVALDREYGFVEVLFRDRTPSLIVDLGANVGMFSIYALSIWPAVTVYSIEPSQSTFQILEHNRALNPGVKWRVYRYALWKENGAVTFENRAYSTSSRIDVSGVGDEVVPALSLTTLLSTFAAASVDLMKVDIEGAEEAVLVGNERVLENVEHLVVEVHPQICDHDRVVATLRAAFSFLYRIPGRQSSKPLLLASRRPYPFPEYQGV